MNWHLLGNCVVVAECVCIVAFLVRVSARALRRISASLLLALSLLATGTGIVAQKTNNVPPNMNQPQMMQGPSFQTGLTGLLGIGNLINLVNPVPATIDDISRGWRVESVTTNAAVSYAMPTNAVLLGNWHVHGATSSFGNNRIDFGDWAFPLGTNDEAFSSFWYFIDGRIRPTPKDAMREICAVGVPMSAVPGQSRLWMAEEPDGARVITWENFFLGGDTNAPVNAQIVLYPNGDFVTRSNEVETVCRRVNPDDWDDDGIHNERDVNPTSCDGDFFGVANALPPNANPDAYYWLDMSATGALGVATIRVACDGPSDLGDHLVIARTNQVCHIPLLAGATYAVESDLPIDYSAVSSEYADIVTNAENRLTVSLPLELSLVRIQTRNAGTTINYGAASSPINVYPSIIACLGGCCSRQVVDGILQWSCSLTCTCGGGYHSFETTALWEGYSKLFIGYASCGCWEDAPDPTPTPSAAPYAASVSACFSKDAVIFEDGYENSPGEWVSRRSTATMLTISANGGTNGAVLSVSATNLGKLQKNSGPAFPSQSVSVPAMQSITYAMNYVGLSASGTADDIEVVATLTDNVTGESTTNDCHATSVRLELAAVWEAPENPCTNRHVYGVGERVRFRTFPESVDTSVQLTRIDTSELSYYDNMINPSERIYACPIYSATPDLKVVCGEAEYRPEMTIIEPQEVISPNAFWDAYYAPCLSPGSVGGTLLAITNYVGPMNVSFHGIMVSEIPCTHTNMPSGFFATPNYTGQWTHNNIFDVGWAMATRIAPNNYWTVDQAGHPGTYNNWSAGRLVWDVPIGWVRMRFDGDDRHGVRTEEHEGVTNENTRALLIGGSQDAYQQIFSISEDGTATIEKHGHTMSRGRFCRIIVDGKTIQWMH